MPRSLCVFLAALCLAGCTASVPLAGPDDGAAVAAATDVAADPHTSVPHTSDPHISVPHWGDHEATAPTVMEFGSSRTGQECTVGDVGGPACRHFSSRRLIRAWIEDPLPRETGGGETGGGETGGGETGGQLYVTGRFEQGWAFQDSVSSGGRSLPVTVIGRDVEACEGAGCTVVETVGVRLTPEALKAAAAQGVSVELSGGRDSMTLALPPAYFARFLEAREGSESP